MPASDGVQFHVYRVLRSGSWSLDIEQLCKLILRGL